MKTISLIENNTSVSSEEAYKVLRTNVQFCGKDIKTIVVTSYRDGDGKTTVSISLAKDFANIGKKVLLIDGDLRRSAMISDDEGGDKIIGLSHYLSGLTQKEEIFYKVEDYGFDVIFAGVFPQNPCEMLGSDAFKELIADAREKYDYVIIDSPPVGLVIDSAVIGAVCDASVIVVRSGKAYADQINSIKETMNNSGAKVIGTVLNGRKKKTKNKTYGYYYTSSKK